MELPSLPEMVFPRSTLRLEHESGAVLEFLALEALKLVNPSEDLLKVAVAEEWTRQRCVCGGGGGGGGGLMEGEGLGSGVFVGGGALMEGEVDSAVVCWVRGEGDGGLRERGVSS